MTNQWNGVDRIIEKEGLNNKLLFNHFYKVATIFFIIFILIQLLLSSSWLVQFLFKNNIDQVGIILSLGLIAVFISMGLGSASVFKDSKIKSWLKPLILPLGFLSYVGLIAGFMYIIYIFKN